MPPRKILAVGHKRDVMEGAGEIVGRVLPQPSLGLEPLDPFLMLDHFKMQPGGPGFPEHPHRGFEILTYMRSGWGSHEDNLGNRATVKAGGLMRLRAGKGLWHGEKIGSNDGSQAEGLQFWVNSKKSDKQAEPGFQYLEDPELPRQTQDEGRTQIKVLVGPGSPVQMLTPTLYLEVSVKAQASFRWDIPSDYHGFVYVLQGTALFPADQARAAAGQVAVLAHGDELMLTNEGEEDLIFMLAAGQPHGEPVIWNGPFVD